MNITGVVQKGLPVFLTHFKKHWWKWVLLVLALGFAGSGFTFESEKRVIKKSPFKALPEKTFEKEPENKRWEYPGYAE